MGLGFGITYLIYYHIIFVFRYVLKGFTTLNVKLKRKFRITGFYPDWANPTYQIVRVIVFCFYVNRDFSLSSRKRFAHF
jgi:hypothetical protein